MTRLPYYVVGQQGAEERIFPAFNLALALDGISVLPVDFFFPLAIHLAEHPRQHIPVGGQVGICQNVTKHK